MFFDTGFGIRIIGLAGATIAQSVEQLIRNQQVVGSIPVGSSNSFLLSLIDAFSGINQSDYFLKTLFI